MLKLNKLLCFILIFILCFCPLISGYGCNSTNDGYDTSFIESIVFTDELVTQSVGYESTYCVNEGYTYGDGENINTGLLVANMNCNSSKSIYWSMDLTPTFKGNTEIEYLLPKVGANDNSWGVTGFALCKPNGEEVGYVGRMHYDGNGHTLGREYGTGYVYDGVKDKYYTMNTLQTAYTDITKKITSPEGNAPYFEKQQTLPKHRILPNSGDVEKGKLIFEWNEDKTKIIVKVTVLNKGIKELGEITANSLLDGYKIRIRNVSVVKRSSSPVGTYTGVAHSVLCLSINGIDLSGETIKK